MTAIDPLDIPDPGERAPLGDERCAFIGPTLRPGSRVTAGDFSYYDASEDTAGFEECRLLYASGPDRLSIGRFCAIAAGVTFVMAGANHIHSGPTSYPFHMFAGDWQDELIDALIEHRADRPVRTSTSIGDDVWIGRDATIMPGVTVAPGTIIGAHAVVAADVAPYQIVAGNPARVVRVRYPPEEVDMLLAAQWWNWPVATISRHLRDLVLGRPADVLSIARREGLSPR